MNKLKAGDKITVTVRFDGNGQKQKTNPTTQIIAVVYDDGRVKTTTGDVWTVKGNLAVG